MTPARVRCYFCRFAPEADRLRPLLCPPAAGPSRPAQNAAQRASDSTNGAGQVLWVTS